MNKVCVHVRLCVGKQDLEQKRLYHNHNHDHAGLFSDLRSAHWLLVVSCINIKWLQRSDLRSAWNGGSDPLIFSCNYDSYPTIQWGKEGSTCGTELKGGDEGVAHTEMPQIANNQNKRQSECTTSSKNTSTLSLSLSPSNCSASPSSYSSSSSFSTMDFLFVYFSPSLGSLSRNLVYKCVYRHRKSKMSTVMWICHLWCPNVPIYSKQLLKHVFFPV